MIFKILLTKPKDILFKALKRREKHPFEDIITQKYT